MELMQASNQWATRPDDERYLSLEELHAAVLDRANRSEAQVLPHHHIEAFGDQANGDKVIGVKLPGIDQQLGPTHWSFGQVCSRSKVPASFARETHPQIAADAINYGLRFVAPREQSQVMIVQRPEGELELRCITGANYGRIYDHRVVEAVMEVNRDGRWVIPAGSTFGYEEAVRSKRSTTLYASDRDVFMFLVDPSTPIELRNPRTGDLEVLHRGFFCWNSEVGAATMGLRTFLYRHVCDNRIVWGAQDVRTLKIRHTSGGPDRFKREGRPMLTRYATASAEQTAKVIEESMKMEVGKTDDDVEKWLRKRQFTGAQAKAIVKTAKAEEGEARTVWQLVQGGTANARSISHTDSRLQAERAASRLLDYAEARAA